MHWNVILPETYRSILKAEENGQMATIHTYIIQIPYDSNKPQFEMIGPIKAC